MRGIGDGGKKTVAKMVFQSEQRCLVPCLQCTFTGFLWLVLWDYYNVMSLLLNLFLASALDLHLNSLCYRYQFEKRKQVKCTNPIIIFHFLPDISVSLMSFSFFFSVWNMRLKIIAHNIPKEQSISFELEMEGFTREGPCFPILGNNWDCEN